LNKKMMETLVSSVGVWCTIFIVSFAFGKASSPWGFLGIVLAGAIVGIVTAPLAYALWGDFGFLSSSIDNLTSKEGKP